MNMSSSNLNIFCALGCKFIAIFCTNVTLFCFTLKYDQLFFSVILAKSSLYNPDDTIQKSISFGAYFSILPNTSYHKNFLYPANIIHSFSLSFFLFINL